VLSIVASIVAYCCEDIYRESVNDPPWSKGGGALCAGNAVALLVFGPFRRPCRGVDNSHLVGQCTKGQREVMSLADSGQYSANLRSNAILLIEMYCIESQRNDRDTV